MKKLLDCTQTLITNVAEIQAFIDKPANQARPPT